MMNTVIRWGTGALAIGLVAVMTACGGGGGTTTAPAPVVATVEIEQKGALLQQAGETRQLSAVARDAQGNALDVPIAWSSGKAAVIAVDAAGKLTASSAAGSSQIVASAQGVRSAPVLAVVTQPAAGSVLVSDAQVLGEPVETDPNAAPSMANTYRVTLSGDVPAPALGTLLVGTGSKAVAGRVVAVDSSVAGQTTVTLGLVPLPVLFPNLQLDEVFDLSMAAVIYSDEVLAHYTVQRMGDTHTFTPKPGVQQARERMQARGPVGTRRALGAFSCDDSSITGVAGDSPLPVQLAAPPQISITVAPSVDWHIVDGSLDRFIVKAEPKLTIAAEVKVGLVFEGKLSCATELFVIAFPAAPGALSLVLSGLVPVGAGFELSGKLTLAEAKFTANVEAKAQTQVGFECASCPLDGKFDPSPLKFDWAATLPSAGLGGLRLEPALEIFGTVDAALGNRFIRARWEFLKVRVGGKVGGSFMTRTAQIVDEGYASDYKLSLEGKAGVGLDVETVLDALGLTRYTLAEATISKDLATSPAALVSTDRASFTAGDTVNLKAVLDPSTFLGMYNVDRVEWVHKVGTTQTTIATQTANSGQTEFTHALTTTTAASAGDYYAFVIPRWPELPLELGKVSLSEATPQLLCPRYEVDVRGETDTSDQFSVNAHAGFSVDGAYGSASIGGNATAFVSSAYPGASTASADVTYLVEVNAAPETSFDTVWTWRTSFEVGPGGGCNATFSIGGISETISSIVSEQRDVQFTTRVRHGDAIKMKLDATCTSPGLVPGPPEILVDNNISSGIDFPDHPDVRFRAVMCNR